MSNIEESQNFSILNFTGRIFNSETFEFYYQYWNSEVNKWQHKWTTEYLDGTKRDFFEYDNTRLNGVFMIFDCLHVPGGKRQSDVVRSLNVHCDPYIDKYMPVHPSRTDEDWINPIFRENGIGKDFGIDMSNPNYNFAFQDFHIVYDGRPNFYIGYTNLSNLNQPRSGTNFFSRICPYEISVELEELYIKQHPHFCARTLGELFKLIIDWDHAYHYFNNRENVAVICHKIMGSIDMPISVYQAIDDSMPDSVVAKYIKGDSEALVLGDRPETPDIVIKWFKEKYWDLRHTIDESVDNTNKVNNSHYYKNNIFNI